MTTFDIVIDLYLKTISPKQIVRFEAFQKMVLSFLSLYSSIYLFIHSKDQTT